MLRSLIELCGHNRKAVYLTTAVLCGFAAIQASRTPLDALPDISDTQVIIATDWMGQSPTLIEQQVTYPIITTFLSAPHVKLVRGFTMVGMSFVYVIFEDGVDPVDARTAVTQYLPRVQGQLPPGVTPKIGPDATSLGWVFEYALVDESGKHDLVHLRTFQDWTLRYWLASVPGVAEVASVGGFVREFQIELDPLKAAAVGVTLADVADAVRSSNVDVGGRVIEMAGHEYIVRGRGLVNNESELRTAVVKVDARGVPVRVSDLARVVVGGGMRRGITDLNGVQEVVGAIVIMRQGENALQVIDRIKAKIAEIEPSLPEGVKILPTYDRSLLIRGSVRTLMENLLLVMLVVIMTIALALLHVRSSLVPIIALPAATLLAFLPLGALNITVNIMSLAGIIIAIGDMVDSAVVMIEEAHRRLAANKAARREDVIIGVAKDLGPSLFGSLLVIMVSFLPVFALQAEEGRLFRPLAMTKGFAMLFAAILGITLVPALMVTFIKGRIRSDAENPVARIATAIYRPLVRACLKARWLVAFVALLMVGSAVYPFRHIGSEFLPPLDEGDALLMPITLPSVSIGEAKRLLQEQDRRVKAVPEVELVFGKLGRADTATDPAPLSMFETVVRFKPRDQWRPGLTRAQLQAELEEAAKLPGLQNAWTMPIKARVDMLSTGIRTAVGVKIHGRDLGEIARLAEHTEMLLRNVPGSRSVYAEREMGGKFLDFIPDRDAIARYGLRITDVLSAVEMGIGGMEVSTAYEGSSRVPVVIRYPRDVRQTMDALEKILVPIAVPQVATAGGAAGGAGMAGMAGGGGLPMSGGTVPRSLGAAAMASSPMGGMGGGGSAGGSMGASMGAGGGAAPGRMAAGGMGGGIRTPVAAPAAARGFVPLAQLGRFETAPGPAMIKDEGGMLTGWVYVDVDESKRDIGSYVVEARELLDKELTLPAGYLLKFSGQYEFMERTARTLAVVVPVTLLLIFLILFLNFRRVGQVLLVMVSVPFAAVGSLWLLWALKFNSSVAVWVGMIALLGIAAETASVMVIYLDGAFERWRAEGRLCSHADLVDMAVEGAAPRVRPLLMTVGMNLIGLIPVLVDDGVGADMAKRIAAPMWGGLVTLTLLTLFVIPALYVIWRSFGPLQSKPIPVLTPTLGSGLTANPS